ncbi:amidohydrolase [Sphingomonas sp. PB4P5]|uniref:amidohydrolase n=1 Tax=Parasphingomonas puruogangriensis TaxID=3096155 RepID=UPI002FCB8A5D
MNKIVAALLSSIMLLPMSANADALGDAVKKDLPSLLTVYRDLHAHPELAFEELRSAAILATEARKLGFTVTTGVGKTGIVAVLRNGPGPVLLLRADMDALPVVEDTGLPFASTVRQKRPDGSAIGVMHACGHDTHMTAWIGTARRLAAMKDLWSGTLVMIGQPAEEVGGGAAAMLADGLYTRFPKPSVAIAFHDSAALPAGTIGYAPGPVMANVDTVDMVVRGIGGHGAYPASTKDPIVLASRIVTALQTLVAREIDPLDSGVVTVGLFQAGTKESIIPDEAHLRLTVRSLTPDVRRRLLDGIARIARGEAIAAGMPEDRMPIVSNSKTATPAAINSAPLTATLADVFAARFGQDRMALMRPQMGGEDFSRYRLADEAGIQSVLFFVGGVAKPAWAAAGGDVTRLPALHSAKWAPDAEPTIATAVEAMTAAALAVLPKP